MSSLSIATATEVFDLVRDDLAAIEREFARQSASDVEVVTDIARYLIAGGGKRIRPLLLLLSAKALNCQSHSRIRLGAVVEMLHTATLVHDDIIDEASTRRGRPSSNATWGNAKCVLAGDWLFMQSFQTALEERNFRILDLLVSLTQQMVEGELLQMEKLGHLINEEEYFDLIFRKSGVPVQGSRCNSAHRPVVAAAPRRNRAGARRRVRPQPRPSLSRSSTTCSTSQRLKMCWASLLPPICARARRRSPSSTRSNAALVPTAKPFAQCSPTALLLASRMPRFSRSSTTTGSIAYAMDTACAYAAAARQSIAELPDSDAKRALLWVPGFVTSRDR